MNVGRMSMVSFAVFLVGIVGLFAVVASGSPVVLVPFIIVWLGSFADAMYLWVAVMRYGDWRLVKRGSQGTAQVLSAKETSWAMSAGEYEGIGAPTVWKYGLQVSVSGEGPVPDDAVHLCPPAQRRHRARVRQPAQCQAGDRRPQSSWLPRATPSCDRWTPSSRRVVAPDSRAAAGTGGDHRRRRRTREAG